MKLTPGHTFELYCPKCTRDTLITTEFFSLRPGNVRVRCARCDTLWEIRTGFFECSGDPGLGKGMWFKQEVGMNEVMKALAELYTAYYEVDSDVARQRARVEKALERLMIAYNKYLG